ncbi:flavin reductase, partial [Chloroflexota bacterium]
CGIVSGDKTDKVRDCNFKIFYGKLSTAPMIEQCPINMECTLIHTLGSNSHVIVIGRVDGTYISQEFLEDGELNLDKLNPLLWIQKRSEYVAVGRSVGKAWSMGKTLKTTL